MSKWLAIALLGVALGHASRAQQATFAVGPRFAPPRFVPNLTISFHANPFHASPGGVVPHPILFPGAFYGYPFLYPEYSGPLPAPPPPATQVIVVQPAETGRREPEKPIQLLVLERRGDHFVRLDDLQPATGLKVYKEDSPRARRSAGFKTELLQHPLPPTILVFRDGRREETAGYTIIGNILYEVSDYWSTGQWTRSVELTALDLPATVRENEARGLKFNLPTGPHEVVVRP